MNRDSEFVLVCRHLKVPRFFFLDISRCGFLLQGFKEFNEGTISESQK